MRDIVVTLDLAYPRELVWEAISDRDQLGEWLMPNDFAPVVGHEFTFKTDPAPGFDGIVRCRVLEVDAPRRLALTWKGGPLDTRLSFDLTETATGTRLTLRHSGFKGFGNILPRIVLGIGWTKKIGPKLAETIGRMAAQRAA